MKSFWEFKKDDIQREKYKDGLELRYVAFLDILGFKKMVNEDIDNVILALRMMKQYAFEMSGGANNRIVLNDTIFLEKNMKISLFSDSIIISVRKEEALFGILDWEIAWLQYHLLTKGIAIRGGIDLGYIYQDEYMIFGDGLVSAYNLESKYAVFPRVVIGDNVIKKSDVSVDQNDEIRFPKDDGMPFVDYFLYNFPCHIPNCISLVYSIRETIISGLNENDKRVREKYEWLKEYYNFTLDRCMLVRSKSESDKKMMQECKIP